jgi:hypothetical protein
VVGERNNEAERDARRVNSRRQYTVYLQVLAGWGQGGHKEA